MKRLGCLAAVLALLVVAESVPPVGAVTKVQLRAKALSLSNFPTGWSVDNSSSGGAASRPACLQGFKASFKHEVKVTVTYTDGNVPALQETLESGPWNQRTQRSFQEAIGQLQGDQLHI
jgi:hypothetical protein